MLLLVFVLWLTYEVILAVCKIAVCSISAAVTARMVYAKLCFPHVSPLNQCDSWRWFGLLTEQSVQDVLEFRHVRGDAGVEHMVVSSLELLLIV